MSWVYLDDAFYDHPKILAAGPAAVGLWVMGLGWSNRNLTGGDVPQRVFHRLVENGPRYAARLVKVGLLDVNGESYHYHDYSDWNKTAQKRDQAKRAAKARWDPAGSHAPASATALLEHVPESCGSNAGADAGAMRKQCSPRAGAWGSSQALDPKDLGLDLLHHPTVIRANGSKGEEDEDESTTVKIDQAVRLVAERRLAATPSKVRDRDAWLRTTVASIQVDPALVGETDLSVEQLADRIDPPKPSNPLDSTAAAAEAIYARNGAPVCGDCDGTGWVSDGAGNSVIRCGACGGTGRVAQ